MVHARRSGHTLHGDDRSNNEGSHLPSERTGRHSKSRLAIGSFRAFVDASFNANLASVSGNIVFGDSFPNAQEGDASTAGLIDELGAIAGEVPDQYTLTVEFTRVEGDDSVVIILPVGEVSPALELGGWRGTAHGLSRIDGNSVRTDENPTSVQPGSLENGKRYTLGAEVKVEDESATVKATLDGKLLFDWSGAVSRLQPNRGSATP